MTKLNLDEIEKRCEAATEGPWRVAKSGSANTLRCVYSEETNIAVLVHAKDAALIAAARTDIPALVARVRELEALAVFDALVYWHKYHAWPGQSADVSGEDQCDLLKILASEEARRLLDEALALLRWLDKRGGLGLEAHARIDAVLDKSNKK